MVIYDSELFVKLYEIFPDAFSVKKTVNTTATYNGPWGTENIVTGTKEENLAEDILATAKAISRCGNCMKEAIKYIESYASERVQKREIKSFLK